MLRSLRRALPVVTLFACSDPAKPTPPTAIQPPYAPGAPWPKFRGNGVQDGTSSVCQNMKAPGAPWSYATGRGVFSSPVVGADGTIYVGSADRNFYALNPDGTVLWKSQTGDIIDSAGLLDDKGRVYFGSGDSILRALDAKTGATVWQFQADAPSENKAFINWYEGNVALSSSGDLLVPNDNWFLYDIDRDKGLPNWRYVMPDQTWSLPAVDPYTGNLFVGNNNLLALLGSNTFGLSPDGGTLWDTATLGTVAASPLLTPDGKMIVGGFDGYVHAYDELSGNSLWDAPTRDHVYSSPARLPDGTIVQASTDGSIYGMNPANGAILWQYDTPEPIRSSPAVDCQGNIYVGTGDGKLLVLTAKGTLRWSMQLISADRDDLNSSPALGQAAIYLGGETGEIFGIPYDYCLRPEGAADARCVSAPPAPSPDGATLVFTTPFGRQEATPPTSIEASTPVVFSLQVHQNGAKTMAIIDPAAVSVTVDPVQPVTTQVSGDGKFVTVSPSGFFAPGPDGTVKMSVTAPYLVNLTRNGLAESGGTPGGTATVSSSFATTGGDSTVLHSTDAWILTRLSIPLPTIMPSYNQIGFDQLVYVVSFPQLGGSQGIGWMVGGVQNSDGSYAVDPATRAIIPLSANFAGGLVSAVNQAGLTVNVMNLDLPFTNFSLGARFTPGTTAPPTAVITGSANCANIQMYGSFMKTLGMCNPQTDLIDFYGAANVLPYAPGPVAGNTGTISWTASATGVTANISGTTLKPLEHLLAILLVDPKTGLPVSLNYGTSTTRTTNGDGTAATVTIPFGTVAAPKTMTAMLMVDTNAVASQLVSLP